MESLAGYYKMKLILPIAGFLIWSSCSSTKPELLNGPQIENPFKAMEYNQQRLQTSKEPITLKAVNADRVFEVAIPRDPNSDDLDLVVPMSGLNSEGTRKVASVGGEYPGFLEGRAAAPGDRKIASAAEKSADQEVVGTFAHNDKRKFQDIGDLDERLGTFQPSDEGGPSYLAGVDKVRSEYFARRYEVALIEVNKLIRYYPTSAKIFMMKGTILKKMGFQDLAMHAYEQAYELDPSNTMLRNVLAGAKSSETRKE